MGSAQPPAWMQPTPGHLGTTTSSPPATATPPCLGTSLGNQFCMSRQIGRGTNIPRHAHPSPLYQRAPRQSWALPEPGEKNQPPRAMQSKPSLEQVAFASLLTLQEALVVQVFCKAGCWQEPNGFLCDTRCRERQRRAWLLQICDLAVQGNLPSSHRCCYLCQKNRHTTPARLSSWRGNILYNHFFPSPGLLLLKYEIQLSLLLSLSPIVSNPLFENKA